MESEILPCPFCGSMCILCGQRGRHRFVSCARCGYSGPFAVTEVAAIAAHNRISSAAARAEAAEAERDALRAALEAMVDSADADDDIDDPKGWASYTAAREALGVPVALGRDAFSGREFYDCYRLALRTRDAAPAATAPAVGEEADRG